MTDTPTNSPEAIAVIEAARKVITVHRELAFSPGIAGRQLEEAVEAYDERFSGEGEAA